MPNKLILFLTSALILIGCSSADEEARELIANARVLYEECGALDKTNGKTLEYCIPILTKANDFMNILYENYDTTPASNELMTLRLKQRISSRLSLYQYSLKNKMHLKENGIPVQLLTGNIFNKHII